MALLSLSEHTAPQSETGNEPKCLKEAQLHNFSFSLVISGEYERFLRT